MSDRAKNLSERFKAMNDDIIAFIQTCGDEKWTRICKPEDWSIGVTARHIAADHYAIVDLAKKVMQGRPLPPLTMEELTAMANRHAAQYADCTRSEVLALLIENGQMAADFIGGLTDENLEEVGELPAIAVVKITFRLRWFFEFDRGC